jgi:hypothetical protein
MALGCFEVGKSTSEDFRAQLSLPFQGPKKVLISRPTPSSDPQNEFALIKIIAITSGCDDFHLAKNHFEFPYPMALK